MSTVQEEVATLPVAERRPGWKLRTGTVSAVVLSLLFLASGIWKLTDLDATAERMVQTLVPVVLSMPTAVGVAICETFAGLLLLIPRYRRWGAWIAGLMLVAFMIYVGILYNRLLGEDCNCFPWIQRVVGPAFFAGDAAMLALAALAARWSRDSHGWHQAAAILGGVCLLAGASFALSLVRRAQSDVPETAIVDGRPLNLRQERVLLYFFDPECTHCLAVAQEMGRRDWGSTAVVALATREQRFAAEFVRQAGLRAGISPDAEALRKAIAFTDPPYAIALTRGKVVARFNSGQMESAAFFDELKRQGHLKKDCQ